MFILFPQFPDLPLTCSALDWPINFYDSSIRLFARCLRDTAEHRLRIRILRILKVRKIQQFLRILKMSVLKFIKFKFITFIATKFQQTFCRKTAFLTIQDSLTRQQFSVIMSSLLNKKLSWCWETRATECFMLTGSLCLSRTVFEINGDFSWKSQNFSTPCVFCAPAEGGIGYRRWGSKIEWRCYRAEKEVWRYLQPSGYNTPTWRTDWQTDGCRTTAKIALTHSVAR